MATISTSQDFDSAARTAGETFTVDSNAVLTINTDTRWHKNAPTGAGWGTGAVGSLTLTAATGAAILIDARNVKWVPYTGGSGNVPTLGSTITGGTSGVTGELLGAYSALNVAPTAAGSALPASGFLKFKSTSGNFNTSEALSGITATTNGSTVTGWIEVTMCDASITTVSRPGKFETKGDWFYLSNTTGARNQTIQLPNPGGANFYSPGIWIEDGFLEGAIADDGGVLTSQTAEANNDTTNDITLLPAVPQVNDAYYFGYEKAKWEELNLYISTQGVGTWTITWEYWDGNAWSALSGVSDGTTGFTAATGWRTVTWTKPTTWPTSTILNQTAYWIRARVSAYTSVTTQPKGQQAGVGKSGEYEFWFGVLGTTYFGTSHLGTDYRSRAVQTIGSGQVRIGYNGSSNVGALPPYGCRTRIPNILLKSCAAGGAATDTAPNATLATRPDFDTSSAGRIDIDYTIGHWYFSIGQPYSFSMQHSSWFDQISLAECATPIVMTDTGDGSYNHADVNAVLLTSNLAGGTFTKCKWGRSGSIGSGDYGTNMTYCRDMTFVGCLFDDKAFRTNATGYAFYAAYCSNLVFTNTRLVGHAIFLTVVNTATLTNTKYADSYHTTSSATGAVLGCINVGVGCSKVKVDGFSWYTAVPNVHPDVAAVYTAGASGVKIRNIGSRTYPLDGGSSNAMLYVVQDAGNVTGLEVKRVYGKNIATRFVTNVNSTKGVEVTNCAGDYADAMGTSGTAGFVGFDGVVKGLAAASAYTAYTAVYGTIFYNLYTSTTAGRLGLMFNEETATYAAYVTKTLTGGSGFTSTGTLALQNLNDEVIYEYPYWIYGIDSFQNSAPTLSGTGTSNHTVEYQIDTGSGYGGTWKASTGANLSGETFTATGGFRLKLRVYCNTASTTNALTGLYILTNANTTAQDVMYDLDPVTVTITCKSLTTGLPISGARVLLKKVSDGTTVLTGLTNASGELSGFYGYTADTAVYGWARSASGVPLYKEGYILGTIGATGLAVTVVMAVDE